MWAFGRCVQTTAAKSISTPHQQKNQTTSMISAIEWIPVGRANPNPSKYEYSRAERDFLSQLVAAQQTEEEEEGAGAIAPTTNKEDGDDTGSNDDDEWEDVDDDNDDDDEEEKENGTDAELKETGKLPKVDPSSLPADLRMDEYSDDDDAADDDDDGDRVVGGLLGVGRVRLGDLTDPSNSLSQLDLYYFSLLFNFFYHCWHIYLLEIIIAQKMASTSVFWLS